MLWKYLNDDNSIREAFTEYALIDNDNSIARNNYYSCQSYDEVRSPVLSFTQTPGHQSPMTKVTG